MTEKKRTRNASARLDSFTAARRIRELRESRAQRFAQLEAKFDADEQATEDKIRNRVPEDLRGEVDVMLEAIGARPGPTGDLVSFGVDPSDSESLERLRIAVDQHIGWENHEQEEAGEYEARIAQIGELLRLPVARAYQPKNARD